MKHLLAMLTIGMSLIVFDSSAMHSQQITSKEFVAKQLNDLGINLGYDRVKNRFVQSATAIRETKSITSAGFTKLRDDLAMAAILDAKAKIAHLLRDEITASEMLTQYIAEDGSKMVNQTAVSKAVAQRTFLGMTILCTAESFIDGIYSVTAAVAWSPSKEASVRKQFTANLEQKEDIKPSPEWKLWADKQNFAILFGPRTFVDTKGIRRYVGIGVVDIEDKDGAALVSAMRSARVKASRNLLFSIFSDLVATEFVKQTLTTRDGVLGALDSSVKNSIIQRCNSKHLFDDEVYTITIKHPITGRSMFVSVAGIEPAGLAKMNLLETIP